MKFNYIMLLIGYMFIGCTNTDKMKKLEINEMEGLWQLSETVEAGSDKVPFTGITDQHNFIVGSDWIILTLFSRNKTKWTSDDNIYKLKN